MRLNCKGPFATDTKYKENYKLKTLRRCGISLFLMSDSFLLFILLLIFSHSSKHVGQDEVDLFKSISDINFFLLSITYFQPAAVITSNAAA